MLAQTGGYQRLALAVQDSLQQLAADPLHAGDSLIIDIDEDSLRQLKPYLGPWPYNRDIFALITDYLHEAGAKSVVYDILFADARPGDDQFAAAIRRAGNVSLAGVALPYPVSTSLTPLSQSARQRCDTAPRPVRTWPDMILPTPTLANASGGNIGIISVSPDGDGLLRRISLWHATQQNCLPNLALAALYAGQPPSAQDHRDHRRWPLAATGDATLYFPNNQDSFLVMPFHRLAMTVLGSPEQRLDASEFKDKTIFIGSTAAFFADSLSTPRGQLPGVAMLALMHHNLAHDRLLLAAGWGWNIALVVATLALPLWLVIRRAKTSWAINAAVALGASAAIAIHYLLLRSASQQADIAFALTSLVLLWLLLFSERLWRLSRERQRLITEKRVAEQANQLKSQFLATMTHELRTPLTAIIGFNRLLAERNMVASEGQKYVDIINANGEHLLALINNLLDQAKVESGQMNVQSRPTELRPLIDGVSETLLGMARSKGLTLSVSYAQPFPHSVKLDPVRLRQILLNLVGNAVKFTEQGAITLHCAWHEATLTLTVQDTGPGIPPPQLERIFDSFYQTDHDKGGSGLGLMISRTLARLMGGDITVSSRVGNGTCFSVRLPAPLISLTAPPVTDAPSVPPGNAPLVLLVEDSDDIRMLTKLYLNSMGYKVILAENGRQGVSIALAQRPDIVLMDLEMPEMDGKHAVRELRQAGFTQPIVALTAHTVDAVRTELLALGFTDSLTKTANRDTLQAAISRLLPGSIDHLNAS